jgi:multidrug efflux pump subunit AcrA (membrane-fusion protein)
LEAALVAAIASRDEAERGPKGSLVEQERQSVRAAELAVEAARIRLRDAQIISPFDGTVAAINTSPGEFLGPSPATPTIVLLTPDALVLKMQIGETDYPNVHLDQTGIVVFDAIPGTPYSFRVIELSLSPTVTQGVVTYEVVGAMVLPPAVSPPAAASPPNAVSPPNGVAPTASPRPAPGMNARGVITTGASVNVLVVPPRAIHLKGGEQVVDVRRNGQIEEQVITTGLSDTTNVEVVAGLEEGAVLVVPVLVSGSSSQADKEPTLPSGIR